MSEITELLQQLAPGRDAVRERLYTLLYAELKRLARSHLAGAGPITLDPSAIVHEAWIRSRGAQPADNRRQFFAHASAVMRSVIIDHVRARAAQKRGGGAVEVTPGTATLDALPSPPEPLRIDDALRALEQIDARCHQVVEMRYFGGLTLEEIADVLNLSVPTIKRDWRRARAFLFEFLGT